MTEKAKTQIIVAVISGIVAVVTSHFGTRVALDASGSEITGLKQQANELRGQITNAVPTGSIVAYAGPLNERALIKLRWLPCDGRSVTIDEYPELFAQIKTCWGGDGIQNFNLPDLRGEFLRGVDPEGQRDPDRAGRTDAQGKQIGPLVGSYQSDMLASHKHPIKRANGAVRGGEQTIQTPGQGYGINQNAADILSVEPFGGNETRPKNVYVYYLIKY